MSALDEIAELLSEGLDLCVRARGLDAQADRAMQSEMGRIWPEGPRCGTPALWVQDQYEKDLADWEGRARSAMVRLGLIR
jgi:hypothetical protein